MNKRQIANITGTLILASFLTGCHGGVIPAGPDTFEVTSSGAGFSSAGVRARVYRRANKYCERHGLVMVPVSIDVQEGHLARNPPTATLVFRALKPGDPEIQRPSIEKPTYIQRIEDR